MRKEVKGDRELQIDLWVCNHFKVLPTEQRFKDLTPWQKTILWLGSMYLPDTTEMRHNILMQEEHERKTSFSKEQEAALIRDGMSPTELDEIKNSLAVLAGKKHE